MKVFKVTIKETSSSIVFIRAKDELEAKHNSIFSEVNMRNNQDLEQEIIYVKELSCNDIPNGIIID